MDVIRVYLVIFADIAAAPPESLWKAFFRELRNYTLTKAIIATASEASHEINHDMRSSDRKKTLVEFELPKERIVDIIDTVDEQSVIYGITGNFRARAVGVLLEELREAARALGHGGAANNIVLDEIAWGSRETSIAKIKEYLLGNF